MPESSTKRIVVLGSTGSIGTQTLDVCRWRGYRVVGLAAGKNLEALCEQILEFRPEVVAADPSIQPELRQRFPDLKLAPIEEVAAHPSDVVVGAVPGLAGFGS